MTIPGHPCSLKLIAPNLTARQAEVLYAIAMLATQGAVKMRQLAAAIGSANQNLAHKFVAKLERAGYIVREPMKAGTIRLAKPLQWEEVP